MVIYNSLTKKLSKFIPLTPKKVSIYVCGITPYDTTHLGHAFTYIFFDTLIRYLKFKGFQVTYTQNVTDINDRDKDILEKARKQRISWNALAELWTKKFLEDMQNLNWVKPDYFLNASQQIPEIINLIQILLNKGYAYSKNNSVYFDISKGKDYGKLSKFGKSKMLKTAAGFEEDLTCPDKKHPLDITLWRAALPNQPKHIPFFESPFGKGRPGWHIECSAISMSTLGEQIDIHGGGIDLIYPHHESEITQSEAATGKIPFAKYWLHSAHVLYQGEKMSKSKGNLVMISDLLKKYSPNAIRWLLLSHHWRKDWEYLEEDLITAQKNVETVEKSFGKADLDKFTKLMDYNLNTPKALNSLQKFPSKEIYSILGFKY